VSTAQIILCFIIICSVASTHAQELPHDTTATDTVPHTQFTDTLRIPPIAAIPSLGSTDRRLAITAVIADSMLYFLDYRSFADLLSLAPGVYVRNLGSTGQWQGITMQGVDDRSIAITVDGILANDPLTGRFNTNFVSTEQLDRIEVVPATQAYFYGFNGTGGATNIVTMNRLAPRPFTRIRYSEGPYGFSFVDGLASQNILRGLNLTIGAAHPLIDGRYPNSGYNAWTARAKLRYNVSSAVNLYFSEIYNSTDLGLNGGIDPATPLHVRFDRIAAAVRSTTARESVNRHDLQLGALARLLPNDTVATTAVTLFYSTALNEYRDGTRIAQDHRTRWHGMRATQDLYIGEQYLYVGAEVQSRRIIASSATGNHRATLSSLFGRTEFRAGTVIQLTPSLRIDRYAGTNRIAYGVTATASPAAWVGLTGGYSRSYRFPTFQERFWQDSVVSADRTDFDTERHDVTEIALRLSDDQSDRRIDAALFHRTIRNPINILPMEGEFAFPSLLFAQHDRETHRGFHASAHLRVGSFVAEGHAQFTEVTDERGSNPSLVPRWNNAGGLYFWDKLFGGHLDLKIGFKGRYFSSHRGVEYNPQARQFVPSTFTRVGAASVLDGVLIARIGDAHIHFIWENLFDEEYVITSFYPMPDRGIRFGVRWNFLD
jgi:outer membrane cobalamin receptor